MENFFGRLLRFFAKLLLAAFGLVFAVSLLVAALVMLVVGLVKWAITGQKPAPVVAFSQFRQFRAGDFKPFSRPAAPQRDVVDVEVRDVTPKNSVTDDRKRLP